MRRYQKAFLCLIALLIVFLQAVFAQEKLPQTDDSLRKIIPSLIGEEKLNAYDRLLAIYMDNLSDDASLETFLALSDEYSAEARAQKASKQEGEIMVTNLIANLRMNHFEYIDKNIDKTLVFLKEHNLTEAIYIAYKQQIVNYCRRGMYEKALAEIETVYNQVHGQNDSESQFYMQYLMGLIYMHQDRLSEAEHYYRQSIEEARKMSKSPFGLIGVYAELCNMLQASGRLDEFFKMALQTEALMEKMGGEDPGNRQNTNKLNLWTLYAFAYSAKGDYDKVELYCNRIDDLYGVDVVSSGNTHYLRAQIWESRGDYKKALAYIDKAIEIDPTYSYARFTKVRILSGMENAPLTWQETERTVTYLDSLRSVSHDRQIDELRARYEVDKLIAEKEKASSFIYFSLTGCILLVATLGLWIYYNREITRKNSMLVKQIRELQKQREKAEVALFNTNAFGQKNGGGDHCCPEQRKEQLCAAIRNALLKEKVYCDSTITRDQIIARLGSNKDFFIDAFQDCFGMSFTEYITFLRLKEAISLLEETDMTIEDISEKVGFGSVRTLQRQFQTKYNMSPKDYRKAAIA